MDEEFRSALTNLAKDVSSVIQARTENGKSASIDRSKVIANWVAAIGIPLVLGISGYFVNITLKTKEGQTKMVELAISILKLQPQGTQEDRQVRGWAIDVIQRFSGVPVAPDARKSLEESQALLGSPIATTLTRLDARSKEGETALGNLVTDAIREAFRSDIAIVNSGSIRIVNYEPGTVLTRRDIPRVIRFGDELTLLSISGNQLINMIETALNSGREPTFPQVSGIRVQYAEDLNKRKYVSELMIKGRRIDHNASYTLATTSFIAQGGDGLIPTGLSRISNSSNGRHLKDVVMLYLYDKSEVSPRIEGRMRALQRDSIQVGDKP